MLRDGVHTGDEFRRSDETVFDPKLYGREDLRSAGQVYSNLYTYPLENDEEREREFSHFSALIGKAMIS